MSEFHVPILLHEKFLLVPIKIDLCHLGARFIDSFTFPLYGSCMTPYEFSCRLCSDLNLHSSLIVKVALQIEEQLQCYNDLIVMIFDHSSSLLWKDRLDEPIIMNLSVRLNAIEYNEIIHWDMKASNPTPESHARNRCAEHGLPPEVEPVIAYKIRENIFRSIIQWIDNPSMSTYHKSEPKPLPSMTVRLETLQKSTNYINELWKRAKPADMEDSYCNPDVYLPNDKETNARVWTIRF